MCEFKSVFLASPRTSQLKLSQIYTNIFRVNKDFPNLKTICK